MADDMFLTHKELLKEHSVKLKEIEKTLDNHDERIKKIEETIMTLNINLSSLTTKVDITNKILFAIFSTLITSIIGYLLK